MSSGNQDRHFEMEIAIAAETDAVWKALVDAREVARWFAPDVDIASGKGGHVTWKWGDQHTWKNVIETFEPGRHLRLVYDSTVDDGKGGKRPLHVDFFLEGDKGTTRLRMLHSGFGPEAAFDEEYDGISGGWPVELRSLRLYLERHRGRDRRVAWTAKSTKMAPDAVWRRLVGEEGLGAPRLSSLREGDAFQIVLPRAGRIGGRALFVPSSREFTGVAENLDDGWFRVHCEHWAGATQVWLWLATYGVTEERMREYRADFEDLVNRAIEERHAGAPS